MNLNHSATQAPRPWWQPAHIVVVDVNPTIPQPSCGFKQCHRLSTKGPGGSMSYVVGLPNNSYKPITNTAWVRARLCKLQKGCTRLAVASDKVYQLLAHGRCFFPGTPSSSTTKIGRHDIAGIFLKLALNIKKINHIML